MCSNTSARCSIGCSSIWARSRVRVGRSIGGSGPASKAISDFPKLGIELTLDVLAQIIDGPALEARYLTADLSLHELEMVIPPDLKVLIKVC